ncbi:MAG: sodium-dependent bicarbonate transport family permease [Planctomycetota bacterium]
MTLDLLFANILSPPILFFAMGMLATALRSDLEIPEPLPKLFGLYLLWAIGFKGGIELRNAGFDTDALAPVLAGFVLSAALPLVAYPLLRLRFGRADACAVAACYGSVSVVTFITASNFIAAQGIEASGSLVAALALMESPAIIIGIMLWRRAQASEAAGTNHAAPVKRGRLAPLLREAAFGGPVFLLLGSMLVGLLSGPDAASTLQPFSEDIFHGVLVLFLLESGMRAARSLGELRRNVQFAVLMSIALPLVNAVIGIGVSRVLGLSVGDAFLLTILCASGSYIAAPAAMRLSIPQANAGVYLPMSLAITFPFNIAIGIPLYLTIISRIWGV